MGTFFSVIYINDLPNELKTNVKLFADDTSIFTTVKDISESANALNNEISLIWKWAFNWKMLFNQNSSKQAQEVLFSKRKKKKRQLQIHHTLSSIISKRQYQKHFGILLDGN